MSKKVIFNTMKATAIESMSQFHQALFKMRELRKQFNSDKANIDKKINETLENRKKAIEGGMDEEEAVRQYDIAQLYRDQTALKEAYRADCKPWKEQSKKALELIPENTHKAYCEAMDKGEMAGLSKAVEQFCQNIGATNQGGSAISKMATKIAVRVSGRKKATGQAAEDGKYTQNKTRRAFDELFMLVLIEYLIEEKGIFVINDDNTLSMKEFK